MCKVLCKPVVNVAFNETMSFETQRMSSETSGSWQSRSLAWNSGSMDTQRLCGGEYMKGKSLWESCNSLGYLTSTSRRYPLFLSLASFEISSGLILIHLKPPVCGTLCYVLHEMLSDAITDT